MKVAITPHSSFIPGIVQRILGELGSGPVHVASDGKVHAELNENQLAMFQLKGAAHQVTILPDTETTPVLDAPQATFPEPEAEEKPLTITIETSPGVRQTMKVGPMGLEPVNPEPAIVPTLETVIAAGYSPRAAAGIVASEQAKSAQGIMPYGNKPITDFVPPTPETKPEDQPPAA